jgi:hypothetical protein
MVFLLSALAFLVISAFVQPSVATYAATPAPQTFTGYVTTEDDFVASLHEDTAGMVDMKMMAESGLGLTFQQNGKWVFYYLDGTISGGNPTPWTFNGTGSQLTAWNIVTAQVNSGGSNNPVPVTVTGILNGNTETNPGMDTDGISYPVITASSITAGGSGQSGSGGSSMPSMPGSPAATTANSNTFSDVSASYWGYSAISSLSGKNYIAGYPDGTFKPGASITRAEFVSIISKALKLQAYNPAVPDFSDVSTSDWFYDSVESAVYAGIIKGNGGAFKPDDPITREELAAILTGALGEQDAAAKDISQMTNFTDDMSISSWARGDVAVAIKDGLLKGYTDGSFRPQGAATRAEASAVINSFLSVNK